MPLEFMERVLMCHGFMYQFCVNLILPCLSYLIANVSDRFMVLSGRLATGRSPLLSIGPGHTYSAPRDGLDVMIKVVSYKDEFAAEVEILKYLSSEPVKSHVDNPIVPLIEILHHDGWTFTVQPRWGNSVDPVFESVREGLDFCVQVTKVRLASLTSLCSGTDKPTGRRFFAPSSRCPPGSFVRYMRCFLTLILYYRTLPKRTFS